MTIATKSSTNDVQVLSLPVGERDHAQGLENAPVTLLMYGAYECPHCVEANLTVKEIQKQVGERLRFVFRHFPRPNVHPHAEAAANVAEIAGAQGLFWEMHDTLFEHFDRLDGENLVRYAENLGLDMKQFDEAISKRLYAAKVQEDLQSGYESGVKSTPTFFINGIKHSLSAELNVLVEAIERA
jgi:protein-disulfide isomerase